MQADMGALRKLEGDPYLVAVVQEDKAWGHGLSGTATCR